MLTGSEDAMDPNKLIPLGRFGEAGSILIYFWTFYIRCLF